MNDKLFEALGITPGPWESDKESVWNEPLDYGIVELGQFVDVRKESEKTLKLISTCPEMLEALIKSTIEILQEIEDIGGCDHSVGMCICDLIQLSESNVAIIEKATGKSWAEIKELLNGKAKS